MKHEKLIRRTFELADLAVARGDHPFGALLARDGEIVLEAHNEVLLGRDYTKHAETLLVSRATGKYEHEFLSECALYSSTEPCVMCAGAILLSGVKSVVFGCSGQQLAEIFGRSDLIVPFRDISDRCTRVVEVIGPLLEAEGAVAHQRYWPEHLAKSDAKRITNALI